MIVKDMIGAQYQRCVRELDDEDASHDPEESEDDTRDISIQAKEYRARNPKDDDRDQREYYADDRK